MHTLCLDQSTCAGLVSQIGSNLRLSITPIETYTQWPIRAQYSDHMSQTGSNLRLSHYTLWDLCIRPITGVGIDHLHIHRQTESPLVEMAQPKAVPFENLFGRTAALVLCCQVPPSEVTDLCRRGLSRTNTYLAGNLSIDITSGWQYHGDVRNEREFSSLLIKGTVV